MTPRTQTIILISIIVFLLLVILEKNMVIRLLLAEPKPDEGCFIYKNVGNSMLYKFDYFDNCSKGCKNLVVFNNIRNFVHPIINFFLYLISFVILTPIIAYSIYYIYKFFSFLICKYYMYLIVLFCLLVLKL